ncbi:MAG: hypothetical protein ABH811_01555 [archaeon]
MNQQQTFTIPTELTDLLRDELGDIPVKIGRTYENLPENMGGPGEPRWNRYATIVAINPDLSEKFIGIYKELIFVDGPLGDYNFISARDI